MEENTWFLSLSFIPILLFHMTKLSSSTTLDQLPLLALKNTITSDLHGLLTKNWSTDTSVCNWIGVTCGVNPQRVTALNLSRFDLGGTIAPHVGNLTFLRSLDVSFNKFTGFIPSELSNLRRLEEFNAGVNNLKGSIPPSIFNISTLRILQLSFNQFDGTLPPNMGISLFNLERLYMDGNRLSGPIPSSITNSSKLTILEMAQNSFTGSIPNFGDLRLLQVLRIQGNSLTGAEYTNQELGFLSSLTSCRYLEVLEVSENPLNGILPASTIGNLSTSLVLFSARKCNINGAIPGRIGNLSSLAGLYLYQNQLQGQIPHGLCQVNNLAELDLSANMLIGPIPECFGEVGSLRKIKLGSNRLNSAVPSSFWDLNKLLILNLSSNHLSGNISTQIGNLKAIYKLDLSWNQFSGDIPSSLDSCQSLETLSLSNNMLTGSIPRSLGSVRGLSRLDLSSNNLSGLIPDSLEKLCFLEHFDVSYNSLDGEIPNGGPFVNFTAQSFVHNSALCGLARFQVPPCMKNHERSRSKDVLLAVYIVASLVSAIIWMIGIFVSTKFVFTRGQRQDSRLLDCQTLLGFEWRRISYIDLVRATSGFSVANLLGRGGFGCVYKGLLSDGSTVAVKVFNLETEGAAESFDTETKILSSVRHRNLVRMIGCCTNADFRALVLEYVPSESLEVWLSSNNCLLDLEKRLDIAIDVASALEYLHHYHEFPVVHCDIKPSNVLLDIDMTAHVADFGISKLFDKGEVAVQTTTLGTIGYVAPEYGSKGKVSTKIDVYSFGILLLEMFTRKKPTDNMFGGEIRLKEWICEASERNAMREVVDPALLSAEDQHFWSKLYSVFDLAMQCLEVSPINRIDMIEVTTGLQMIKHNVKHKQSQSQKSSPYYSIAESTPDR